MSDHVIYVNLTAPYASGSGRRTVWRLRARVDAATPEQAVCSQSIQTVGSPRLVDATSALYALGFGWEMWIYCPHPNRPYCKACGVQRPNVSEFCTDCNPRPAARPAQAQPQRVPAGPLATPAQKMSTRRGTSRKPKSAPPTPSMAEIQAMLDAAKARK